MKKVRVVTIAIALALVVFTFSAQPVAAASRYDSLSSYMISHWDPVRGGYNMPDNVVRLDETYGAIVVMDELGTLANRPPPIDINTVLNFTTTYQWLAGDEDQPRYGGFMEFLLGPVTAERTHWGMILWQTLKAEPNIPGSDAYNINETAVLVFVNKTQTASGGFSSEPEANPDIVSTYHSLATLTILDEMYPSLNAWDWLINETATIEWIKSCRAGDGFKLNPSSLREGVTATAAGMLALDILGELSSYPDVATMTNWLLDRQVDTFDSEEFIGGFEESNSTGDPNLLTTFWAVSALELVNSLGQVNQTSLQSFVLNCQSTSGAFSSLPGMDSGTLWESAYAVQILGAIGDPLTILTSSTDPYSVHPAWLDWRLVALGLLVLVVIVLALLSIRMD
ncbi:MAG: prenyltransferase/squalene oxidase repeat-containing protein [Candidatus Thorarchaeota archaeon]